MSPARFRGRALRAELGVPGAVGVAAGAEEEYICPQVADLVNGGGDGGGGGNVITWSNDGTTGSFSTALTQVTPALTVPRRALQPGGGYRLSMRGTMNMVFGTPGICTVSTTINGHDVWNPNPMAAFRPRFAADWGTLTVRRFEVTVTVLNLADYEPGGYNGRCHMSATGNWAATPQPTTAWESTPGRWDTTSPAVAIDLASILGSAQTAQLAGWLAWDSDPTSEIDWDVGWIDTATIELFTPAAAPTAQQQRTTRQHLAEQAAMARDAARVPPRGQRR